MLRVRKTVCKYILTFNPYPRNKSLKKYIGYAFLLVLERERIEEERRGREGKRWGEGQRERAHACARSVTSQVYSKWELNPQSRYVF